MSNILTNKITDDSELLLIFGDGVLSDALSPTFGE
jgi:hypothetical protein